MSTSPRNDNSGRAVTLADIADRCGISKVSVSHALRGNVDRVSKETRERVLTVARELGYSSAYNHEARRLASKKQGGKLRNHTIGIALPDSFGGAAYYGRVLDGIFSVLVRERYGMHITVLTDTDDPLPIVCGRGEIDGMLMLHRGEEIAHWMSILRSEVGFGNRPIVGLVESAAGCSSIHPDDVSASYQAASHLLDLGHRHIAHAFQPACPQGSIPAERLLGMESAYIERGLDPNEFLHCVLMPSNEADIPYKMQGIRDLLKAHPEITAVCARNDFSAVCVWRVLVEAGYRIPEDMSLVSFDDTEAVIGLDGQNWLTTVHLPLYEQGQEGARLIIRLINEELSGIQETTLAAQLVIRKSTSTPNRRA